MLGATGGYLIGFVVAAAVVGRLAELGWDRRFFGALAAMVIGETIIYALGVTWLKVAIDVPVATALDYGLWPFLPGDTLKSARGGRAPVRLAGRQSATKRPLVAARTTRETARFLERRHPHGRAQQAYGGGRRLGRGSAPVRCAGRPRPRRAARRDLRLPGSQRGGQEHDHPAPAGLPPCHAPARPACSGSMPAATTWPSADASATCPAASPSTTR